MKILISTLLALSVLAGIAAPRALVGTLVRMWGKALPYEESGMARCVAGLAALDHNGSLS